MKFPRFLGGCTAGLGLCYLLSAIQVKDTRRTRELDANLYNAAERDPKWREVYSLREQSKRNDVEILKLTRAVRHKNEMQESKYDPTVGSRTRKVRTFVAYLKQELDHQDNEIKWLKKQLGEEDELQGEEA